MEIEEYRSRKIKLKKHREGVDIYEDDQHRRSDRGQEFDEVLV